MLDVFIKEQIEKITENYKISKKDARNYIESKLEINSDLKKLVLSAPDLKNVYRTRVYKDFIKKTKKEIYFGLRTYQKDGADLIDSHISTAERQNHLENFFSQLGSVLKESKNILDLGGGMFPSSFPFEKYHPERFVWIDKDEISYKKLLDFKHENNISSLELHNDSIGTQPWENYLKNLTEFDLVFMLKLIPVVSRQEKGLLTFIAQIPAKNIVVTGSKEAMVKKQDIESREDKIIQGFISLTNRTVVKKVDLGNEFGYLLN